jgi:hypothetical protein
MDKNLHLDSVIKTHQISKEAALLDKFKQKRNEVKELLEANYKDRLYTPFNSGSYAKNTAINTKFDFDMVAPFKRNAFGANGTLKGMYEDVFNFLYEKYKDVADVQKQKVSIGLKFHPDEDRDIVKIDVVPGRELTQDKYEENEDLNLYVYYRYGNFEAGAERIKTNVQTQINNIRERADKDKDSIRKIIRLLKVWKGTKYDYPAKSYFLELITIKAFDSKTISGNLWDKLKAVLEFIKDEVVKESFTLKDPGNTSNDLADTLNEAERRTLSNDMKNILDRVEENDKNIETFFPENTKFKEEEKEENRYGNKGNNLYSAPPKNERFG